MTAGGPREPRREASLVDTVRDGRGRGQGLRTGHAPTTTVPVIPLWQRLRTEARG